MAMLPFIGYNAGDYFGHWIESGKDADAVKLPRIFYVNWFRRTRTAASCGRASARTSGC
jgi:phosphoenolpyruvate carboxykinase (GTP)